MDARRSVFTLPLVALLLLLLLLLAWSPLLLLGGEGLVAAAAWSPLCIVPSVVRRKVGFRCKACACDARALAPAERAVAAIAACAPSESASS